MIIRIGWFRLVINCTCFQCGLCFVTLYYPVLKFNRTELGYGDKDDGCVDVTKAVNMPLKKRLKFVRLSVNKPAKRLKIN
jgi:hypothetical protein